MAMARLSSVTNLPAHAPAHVIAARRRNGAMAHSTPATFLRSLLSRSTVCHLGGINSVSTVPTVYDCAFNASSNNMYITHNLMNLTSWRQNKAVMVALID